MAVKLSSGGSIALCAMKKYRSLLLAGKCGKLVSFEPDFSFVFLPCLISLAFCVWAPSLVFSQELGNVIVNLKTTKCHVSSPKQLTLKLATTVSGMLWRLKQESLASLLLFSQMAAES